MMEYNGREHLLFKSEDWSVNTHLSSVHELLGFIVVDAVYLQKWVGLAEEILQRQQKIENSGTLAPNDSVGWA